eukprot:8114274-Pyramimonas_sp.AAC.1
MYTDIQTDIHMYIHNTPPAFTPTKGELESCVFPTPPAAHRGPRSAPRPRSRGHRSSRRARHAPAPPLAGAGRIEDDREDRG